MTVTLPTPVLMTGVGFAIPPTWEVQEGAHPERVHLLSARDGVVTDLGEHAIAPTDAGLTVVDVPATEADEVSVVVLAHGGDPRWVCVYQVMVYH